jgi:hypothetical protein
VFGEGVVDCGRSRRGCIGVSVDPPEAASSHFDRTEGSTGHSSEEDAKGTGGWSAGMAEEELDERILIDGPAVVDRKKLTIIAKVNG